MVQRRAGHVWVVSMSQAVCFSPIKRNADDLGIPVVPPKTWLQSVYKYKLLQQSTNIYCLLALDTVRHFWWFDFFFMCTDSGDHISMLPLLQSTSWPPQGSSNPSFRFSHIFILNVSPEIKFCITASYISY